MAKRKTQRKTRRDQTSGGSTFIPAEHVDPAAFGLGGPGRDLSIDTIHGAEELNPRTEFSKEALKELAASIEANGLLQPILVRPLATPVACGKFAAITQYQIVAGERRWRAARLANLKSVPCVIRDLTDDQAKRVSLIENLQREGLSPIEEARGLEAILEGDTPPTQRELARQIGKSQAWVANRLRLLELPEGWRRLLISREITDRHARAALAWKRYPVILEVLLQKVKNTLSAGDPVTVEIFEREVIPEVVRAMTRPMDGKPGPTGESLIWDARRGRHVEIFWPTKDQEKELDIVEVGPEKERRATNIEFWECCQEAFLARKGEDLRTVESGKPKAESGDREEGEGGSSGTANLVSSPKTSEIATDGEEDLPDATGEGIPSPKAERAPGPGVRAEPWGTEPWDEKLRKWRTSWMRWLIARALRRHDATYVSDRLAILAIGDWDLIGWAPEADDAIQRRTGKRGWKDAATALWKVPEHELPKVLDELLAELFWREQAGEVFVVPAEQCERILREMEMDLELQWALEQAGDLSEAYWRLHLAIDLDALAKELGVNLGDSRTFDEIVARFLARKPNADDSANEQGDKVLDYPKELKRLR